jgi:hypothetical protein
VRDLAFCTAIACVAGCTLILGDRPDEPFDDLGVADLDDLLDADGGLGDGDAPDQAEPPCGKLGALFREGFEDATLAAGVSTADTGTFVVASYPMPGELAFEVMTPFTDVNAKEGYLFAEHAGDLRASSVTLALGGDGTVPRNSELILLLKHPFSASYPSIAASRTGNAASVTVQIASPVALEQLSTAVPTAGPSDRFWRLGEANARLYFSAAPTASALETAIRRDIGPAPPWVHTLIPSFEVRIFDGQANDRYRIDAFNAVLPADGAPRCPVASLRESFSMATLELGTRWGITREGTCTMTPSVAGGLELSTAAGGQGRCTLDSSHRYSLTNSAIVLHAPQSFQAANPAEHAVRLSQLGGQVLLVRWRLDADGLLRRRVWLEPSDTELSLSVVASGAPYLMVRETAGMLEVFDSTDGTFPASPFASTSAAMMGGTDAVRVTLESYSAASASTWLLSALNPP